MKQPRGYTQRKQQIDAMRQRQIAVHRTSQAEALAREIDESDILESLFPDPQFVAEWLIEHYIIVPRSSPK